jgi:O-methyltransferase
MMEIALDAATERLGSRAIRNAIELARRLSGGRDSYIWRTLRLLILPAIRTKPGSVAARDATDFNFFAMRRSPYREALYTDFSDAEKTIYRDVYANVVSSAEATVALMRSIDYIVSNDIAGDFVECGVYRGGNIEIMIRKLQQYGIDDRDIYLYDTFAGMPRPDAVDDAPLGGALRQTWEAHRLDSDEDNTGSDWMCASVDLVRERLAPLRYPVDRLHFVKGMVETTIPRTIPPKIALLRLDTDFYASTKHELVHLYPLLADRGILIIDDYGAFPGCRHAVDEYSAEKRRRWFLHRVDPNVRLAVKND